MEKVANHSLQHTEGDLPAAIPSTIFVQVSRDQVTHDGNQICARTLTCVTSYLTGQSLDTSPCLILLSTFKTAFLFLLIANVPNNLEDLLKHCKLISLPSSSLKTPPNIWQQQLHKPNSDQAGSA